jgi:sulfate permease, SulP family
LKAVGHPNPRRVALHAGIIEPGHFNFAVAGEPILCLQLRMFYTHKGTEKLFEEVPLHKGALVGGLPLSGDSSHTLENVRLGAQTPVGGVLQAVFLVVFLLIAAPVVRWIPFPVISALILSSVFSMTMWHEIPRLMKARHFEVVSWAATTLLTIFTDLLTAISVGMLMGMFLYIRKLREPARAKLIARLSLW